MANEYEKNGFLGVERNLNINPSQEDSLADEIMRLNKEMCVVLSKLKQNTIRATMYKRKMLKRNLF